MAALTLAVMQARVALFCGNMKTTHPVYVNSNSLTDYINEAANRVILMAALDPATGKPRTNFNAFPELRDRRWFDTTVNNQGYLLIPSNCLVPSSLKYTKSTTTYDPNRDTEYVIVKKEPELFALLSKEATTVGYPQIWTREGNQLLLWPTPTTAYGTQIVLRGIRRESDLSAPSNTLTMDAMWHPSVVSEASGITCEARNWFDEADKWHAAANRKVIETVSLLGANRRSERSHFGIAGAPGGRA